ncbi:MAG: hypothetical protein BAJATHORv1_50148 [Candidatus Thorarchaeota archaeon]|nr:MAG: hypothetical protein BAJATHORv1_50148 [Candidatus Thorarchaeota archaeon]
MEAEEIALIDHLFGRVAPERCLEWGCGGSTLHFSKILQDTSWDSIEHDFRWYKIISSYLEPKPNCTIHHVPFGSETDSSQEEVESYVNFPDTLGGDFDFILVDGRKRVKCLRKTKDILSRRGIVMLHDAGRARYQSGLEGFAFGYMFRLPWYHIGVWVGGMNKSLVKYYGIDGLFKEWQMLLYLYDFIGLY